MYYYHRDNDGREWGPFTDGQLGKLLNLGVLSPRSLLRMEGDTTWHQYYSRPASASFIDGPVDPEFDQKLAAGERAARELELATVRHRFAAERTSLPIPPEWPMVDFAEGETGLIYGGPAADCVFAGGVALRYGDGNLVTAELHLSRKDSTLLGWMADEKRMLAELEAITTHDRQDPRSAHLRHAEYSPVVWLETTAREGVLWHALKKREYTGKNGDKVVEHFTLSIASQRFLHVRFSYPVYLGSLVSGKLVSFVTLACASVRQSEP